VADGQAPEAAERQGWSWKAILLVALGIYAVLLIILNRKTVSVDFVIATEKTRVVWLVLLSIALGALIIWLVPRLRRRHRNRRRASEPADERSGIAGVSWKVILLAALAIYAVLLIVFNSKTVSVNFISPHSAHDLGLALEAAQARSRAQGRQMVLIGHICGTDGDPQDRKIEQPVAHLATMSGRCEVERNANCHKQR